MNEWMSLLVQWTSRILEFGGIAAIMIGALSATVAYIGARLARVDRMDAFRDYRSSLGRSILLGLEFLVAADIIATVAITPTLESLAVLAGIVVIRTFLSLALEVEIDGRWPWAKTVRREDRQFTGNGDDP